MNTNKIILEDNMYYVNIAKVVYTTIIVDASQVSEKEILDYNQSKLGELWNEDDANEYYEII